MKLNMHWKTKLAVVALGALLTGSVQAQSVLNGSFENGPALASGSRSYFLDAGTPANWTQWNGGGTGNGYVQNYSSAQLTSEYGGNPLPDGNYVLGLGRGGASSVFQYLGTVNLGESYTLSGYLGRPATEGVEATGGYLMQLYVGTSWATASPIMTLNNASVTDPTAGTWTYWSGTSSVITAGQNGQNLYAFLYANTGAWPSIREFDNIALAVTPVPEPSTMALAVLGGCGLLLLGRKRR
jgi:hypothetical protein